MIRAFPGSTVQVRPARTEDRKAIENLILSERFSHRHMDWKMPLDWFGFDPYLVAVKYSRLVAVIACPPDPPEIAWIRAFAAGGLINRRTAWESLWAEALKALQQIPNIERALSIVMEDWFRDLLVSTGFEQQSEIRMLSWENGPRPYAPPRSDVLVRPMVAEDLDEITTLDRQAFYPLWHHSQETLGLALKQAVVATVSENADGISGYSISTPSPFGGHLARLAVRPNLQSRGIGYALLYDLLDRFRQRGAMRVTVNTQFDNTASLQLYQKANFQLTGESYAVYGYELF
jgi:ribosomal protein S18 acetylase RimI-like enzyme